MAGTLDLYGNEGDFFIMLLRPFLTSITTTTCCLDTCPLQVNTVQSFSVIVPQPSKSIHNNVFVDALDRCMGQHFGMEATIFVSFTLRTTGTCMMG